MSLRCIVGVVALVLLLTPTEVLAWGPATHVKLATDVLGQLGGLPVALAALLGRHHRDYLFGSIAADVVVAKRLSRVKQICHHWDTGFAILNDARSDRGQAFALGYLSHLAADTVAHNKFLPRQMTLTRSTMGFGHLYWELRADSLVAPSHWDRLRSILSEVFAEHEMSLQSRLTDTFLPFEVNWRLFYRMNRFVSRRVWRRAMYQWWSVSRWHLSRGLMQDYQAECVERIIDVLSHGADSWVCHEDPNGNAALAYTRLQRRQLRQMARAGLISPHILYEAAKGHAPSLGIRPNGHAPTRHVR